MRQPFRSGNVCQLLLFELRLKTGLLTALPVVLRFP